MARFTAWHASHARKLARDRATPLALVVVTPLAGVIADTRGTREAKDGDPYEWKKKSETNREEREKRGQDRERRRRKGIDSQGRKGSHWRWKRGRKKERSFEKGLTTGS